MLPLILLSALALGLYDVARKSAVRDNSVVEVLLCSTLAGALAFLAVAGASGTLPVAFGASRREVGLIALKVLLVGTSWGCVFLALRKMPLTLVAPIRATAPLWTLLLAMPLYGEVPGPWRAVGMALMVAGFVLASSAGRADGFTLKSGPYFVFLLAGTLLGSASALYDKYLLNWQKIPASRVQCLFSLGLVVLYATVWTIRRLVFRPGERSPFQWRWTIPLTGVLLIAADALYFHAAAYPDAPISVLSMLRRTSSVVAFAAGALLFRDAHLRRKGVALALVLAGAILVALGKALTPA